MGHYVQRPKGGSGPGLFEKLKVSMIFPQQSWRDRGASHTGQIVQDFLATALG